MASNPLHAARLTVAASGPAALVVDDLRYDDLDMLNWSGSPTHIRQIAEALQRVDAGEAEYLAVRAPTGEPIAKGGIDYARRDDAGTLWQLAVHSELQGLGIGTRLIREAEERIRIRLRRWAVLAVEDNNSRARALYERLGYEPFGQEADSWEQETDEGEIVVYETTVTLLRRHL